MRSSYLLGFLCVSLSVLSQTGCTPAPNHWQDAKPGQKKILVSFPPLYAITHAVAGENAYTLCLLTTQGPHDYDGSATDVDKVNKADLFIYNGLTLDDSFAKRMLRAHRNAALKTLNVGATLEETRPELLQKGDGQEHDHGDGVKHKHGEHDPHLWLGTQQTIAMTGIIAARLADVDPANKKGYDERAAKFIQEVEKLEADGKAAFKDKKSKKIITMHEAFGYFGKAFGVEIVDSIQTRPGQDPDGPSMLRLQNKCREQKIGVIAVEPQYSPNQAQALQASLKRVGIDVQVISLDPLETAEPLKGSRNPDPDYYFKKMRENIDTLAKALP